MLDIISNLNYLQQTVIFSFIAFIATSLGAAVVFFFKNVNKFVMDISLSLSAGIMLSSTIFSLIIPAFELVNKNSLTNILCLLEFLLGACFIILGDKILNDNKENNTNKLLVFSIILHNIPEGMAIGIAFASSYFQNDSTLLIAAILLSVGIIIQNFPEGSAISLPLKRNGYSSKKSFLYGLLSAIVEPISAVIGAVVVYKINFILPFSLTFASGAMLFIIIKELIPESQNNKYTNLTALMNLFGFILMMLLDTLFK